MLGFGTSWCLPCRSAMPQLESFYDERKTDHFLFLHIDAEQNPDAAAGFKVSAYPTCIFIDPTGKWDLRGRLQSGDGALNRLIRGRASV
jgi:thiol-disulfide isomerase/thioredoxin